MIRGEKVVGLDWDRHRLTPKQMTYAATDAWACRELYLRFQQLGLIDPGT